jgi:hypothetical protein
MAVELPPNGSNLYPLSANNARIGGQQPQQLPQRGSQAPVKPERAHVNYVPANETIATLVQNALSAQKQGVHWDRGSILNLVV